MEQLVSTQGAAKFLGITRPTVIKYIQEQKIGGMRVGKAYKISRQELIRYARSVGMSERRMAGLDEILLKQEKSTKELNPGEEELLLHEPLFPLREDLEDLYFLSVKPRGALSDLILRVRSHKFFIGRHSLASLSIQDPYVSNLHATLWFREERVQVLDRSTNGTRYGGGLLHNEECWLGDGDQLMVGASLLTLISTERIDLYLGSDITADAFHAGRNSRGAVI